MNRAKGFTLFETAVVLVIVALLLGSLLVPLTTQVEQRKIAQAEKALEEIKEALTGFALSQRHLPCPDTTGDGISDPATPGSCTSSEGFLPWVTLNSLRADPWGNLFRYRVSPEFTNTPVMPCATGDGRLGLCDSGNIVVNTRNAAKSLSTLASNAAAVIASHGKNGFGATSESGIAQPAPSAAQVDETTNADASAATFIARTLTQPLAACSDTAVAQPFCEFDDIVTWLSAHILFNRMVAAGKLP